MQTPGAPPPLPTSVYLDRLARARAEMSRLGIDVLLLSLGLDLPYLTGYHAMPLERLTMLVVPHDREATLVIPRLEAPRVVEQPGVFSLHPWGETENPVEIVAALSGRPRIAAIGDQTWARFVVDLLPLMPSTTFRRAVDVVGAMRMVKDAAEVEALRAAGAAVDRIAADLQAGRIPLVGRTEAQVSADLGARIIAEGHQVVNFAIVAAGENAASPHHTPGARVIRAGEVVLCDFGGTMNGYCSDITRCVSLGTPPAEVRAAYDVLQAAQEASVRAATVGTACEDVDRAARRIIAEAGFGEYFVHRTGHGIGMDAHEDPYIVEGNRSPLVAGHAFSIEPGIYVPGRWGMRLEDIVVASNSGPDPLNRVDHSLVVLEV
ncbi:MAG: M24 family metallopeptidase [Actinobacteria bacterium]|nr:M24 family metallopeptidase [Actinomycetota bacterium]MSX80420.1 M24 family metallopeptidase [Actinomycetota bacterium]